MRAMAIWITGVSRASQRVEFEYPPLKRWMDVAGIPHVEASVSYRHNLASPLEHPAQLHIIGVQDLPRNIIRKFGRKIGLDVPHLVDGSEILKPPPLDGQANLVAPQFQRRGSQSGRGRDSFPESFT